MSKKKALEAVVPELAIADAAGNAVSKAGAAIKKPVWGRKRVLTYDTEVERDGQTVKATVVEEDSRELGQGALAVAGVAVVALAGAVATIVGGTKKRLANRQAASGNEIASGAVGGSNAGVSVGFEGQPSGGILSSILRDINKAAGK